MYVCLCKGITDGQIVAAMAEGATSIRDLRNQLGVMTQCGKCACLTRDIVRNHQNQVASQEQTLWSVAS